MRDNEEANIRLMACSGAVAMLLRAHDHGAKRSRIVAINPGKPEKQQWREAVPEGKATLQAANVVNRQATDGPFQLHRKRPNRLAVGEVGLQNRPRG